MVKRPFISHCLWFDTEAEEAARFYTTVFPDSKIGDITYYPGEGQEIHGKPEGSVMSATFTLCGTKFMGLNGGPIFKINPSVSYFIICKDAAEADYYWNKLNDGGKVLMELDKYDWSERYGWLSDKYGLSWQIYTGDGNDMHQKICPSLMYTGKQHGRAEEAVHFYTSIFKDSEVQGIMKYPPGAEEPEGTVMHSQFKLSGEIFMAMDSAQDHNFQFNEGVSFVINCTTQEEIDYYWERLTAGGEESMCGWLKDKFGVSWQVAPVQLDQMLLDPDKEKVNRVTKVFMQMRKFDLKKLEEAFEG
jgi:predicted 3-demethylubiquinone-9 3-methyltransferase (glyoxalase superfamily)